MIARVHVLLPMVLSMPKDAQFQIRQYVDQGYAIRILPPARSDRPPAPEQPDQIKINGVEAVNGDALRIDFHKESFDRRRERAGALSDPPPEVIQRVVNSFLVRLRHVLPSPAVRPLPYLGTMAIKYLNDDESELELDATQYREIRAIGRSMGWTALNPPIWEDLHSLPPDYEPLPWEELLLDALGDLPRVGPAVVLAATALEVFVSEILNALAQRSPVPPQLWTWIVEREDYWLRPEVEEEFDGLLKFFTGHSLKDEAALWTPFKNLKTARNKFVHEGRATIGGVVVSTARAAELVTAALEIVAKVREWLPTDLRWPVFKREIRIEAVSKLLG